MTGSLKVLIVNLVYITYKFSRQDKSNKVI